MKSLHKKISAMVLAGMVISGGCLSKELNVYANNKGDIEKYKKKLYNVELYDDKEYVKHDSLFSLSNDDNDEKVQKIMDRIEKACEKSKIFRVVKLSSEYGKDIDGKERGISGFLEQEDIDKIIKSQKAQLMLSDAQVYFDDIVHFEEYLKKYAEQIESGVYRVQVMGVDGIYMARSGEIEKGEK